MRLICILALSTLMACESGPNIGANVGITPNGVSVNPSVSGRVGGVGVAVSP